MSSQRANQRANDENVPIQRSQGRPNVTATGQFLEYVKQSSDNGVSPDRAFNGQLNFGVPIFSGGAVRNGIRGGTLQSGLVLLRAGPRPKGKRKSNRKIRRTPLHRSRP